MKKQPQGDMTLEEWIKSRDNNAQLTVCKIATTSGMQVCLVDKSVKNCKDVKEIDSNVFMLPHDTREP